MSCSLKPAERNGKFLTPCKNVTQLIMYRIRNWLRCLWSARLRPRRKAGQCVEYSLFWQGWRGPAAHLIGPPTHCCVSTDEITINVRASNSFVVISATSGLESLRACERKKQLICLSAADGVESASSRHPT